MSNVNCRLAWNSILDTKTLTATSFDGNMTVSNLQDCQLQTSWRSLNTQPQEITCDFGGREFVSYLCVYKHNLSYAATIRFVLSNNADYSNPVVDITFKAVRPTYGRGQLRGLHRGGYVNKQVLTPYSVKWISPVFARYFKVIIDDQTNPQGYIQISRLKVGRHFEGKYNVNWGASRGLKSNSVVAISDSGARFVSRKSQQRTLTLDWSYLSANEEFNIFEMQQEIDLDKDVLISVYPEQQTTEENLYCLLGFFESWRDSTRPNVAHRVWGATFMEGL